MSFSPLFFLIVETSHAGNIDDGAIMPQTNKEDKSRFDASALSQVIRSFVLCVSN